MRARGGAVFTLAACSLLAACISTQTAVAPQPQPSPVVSVVADAPPPPAQVPTPAPMPAANPAQVAQSRVAVAPGASVPLSLDRAIALGLDRNTQMTRTRRNVQSSALRTEIAEAQYWPRIDTYGNASQGIRGFMSATEFSEFSESNPFFHTGVTGFANMPIDIFGQVGNQVQQARLAETDAQLSLQQSRLEVTAAIRSAYIEALRSQIALDAERAAVQRIEALLARARTEAEAAVEPLEAELETARQSLSASLPNLEFGQFGLRQLLRLPPGTQFRLTSTLDPSVPVSAERGPLEAAIANRPAVQAAQMRVRQAELSLAQVDDVRKPTVNLNAFGNSSVSGEHPGDIRSGFTSGAAIVNVNVPLLYFDAGALANQRRIAALAVAQSQEDLAELTERIANELHQLTIRLNQARERLQAAPSAAEAEEALRVAEAELLEAPPEEVPARLAQVAAARAAWRAARTTFVDALAEYYTTYYDLRRAIGES